MGAHQVCSVSVTPKVMGCATDPMTLATLSQEADVQQSPRDMHHLPLFLIRSGHLPYSLSNSQQVKLEVLKSFPLLQALYLKFFSRSHHANLHPTIDAELRFCFLGFSPSHHHHPPPKEYHSTPWEGHVPKSVWLLWR